MEVFGKDIMNVSTLEKSFSRFDLEKAEEEIPTIEEEEKLPEIPQDGIVDLNFFTSVINLCFFRQWLSKPCILRQQAKFLFRASTQTSRGRTSRHFVIKIG